MLYKNAIRVLAFLGSLPDENSVEFDTLLGATSHLRFPSQEAISQPKVIVDTLTVTAEDTNPLCIIEGFLFEVYETSRKVEPFYEFRDLAYRVSGSNDTKPNLNWSRPWYLAPDDVVVRSCLFWKRYLHFA